MQGEWVWTLVRDLRSRKLPWRDQKKKKKALPRELGWQWEVESISGSLDCMGKGTDEKLCKTTRDQLERIQGDFGDDLSITDTRHDIPGPHLLLSCYIYSTQLPFSNTPYHPNKPGTAPSLSHSPFGYNMLYSFRAYYESGKELNTFIRYLIYPEKTSTKWFSLWWLFHQQWNPKEENFQRRLS